MAHDIALRLESIVHRYDGVLALDGVSLEIRTGSFTAVLGPNGAGKSTMAMVAGGMLRPTAGKLSVGGADGRERLMGRGFTRLGIVLVPEGRRLFARLSVRENLMLGGYGAGYRSAEIQRRLDEVLEFLPDVRRHLKKMAGLLSGGEQQIVAVARGLMARPKMMILDEPSLGLAPLLADRVYEIISKLNSDGVTIVVIEQIATHAIRHASSMVILDQGRVHFSGSVSEATASEALRVGYFGHG